MHHIGGKSSFLIKIDDPHYRLPKDFTDHHHSFHDTIFEVYDIICNHDIPLSQIKILSYYSSVVLVTFSLRFNDGLVMYDDDITKIKMSTIIPECGILDDIVGKKISKTSDPFKENNPFLQTPTNPPHTFMKRFVPDICTNKISDDTILKKNNLFMGPPLDSPEEKTRVPRVHKQNIPNYITKNPFITEISDNHKDMMPEPADVINSYMYPNSLNATPIIRHKNMFKNADHTKNTISPISSDKKSNKLDDKMKQFDEEFEEQRERNRLSRIEALRHSEKMNTFTHDKDVYQKLKSDISGGKITIEDVHPIFTLKYEIFGILENRSLINFSNDDNVKTEFNLFMDMYDCCKDDLDSDNDKKDDSTVADDKSYTPHNYQYLTEKAKEKYNKKLAKKSMKKDFDDYSDPDIIPHYNMAIPRNLSSDLDSDSEASVDIVD